MGNNDACIITFSEDMDFSMEFSDEFLAASLEEQMDMLKVLLRERLKAPVSTQDVSPEATQNEVAIVLLEACLGQLRLGARIEKDTNIGVYLADLELPFNTWD